MNIIKQQSLSAVVMPLVQLLSDADLAWSDREKISSAIQACRRHHEAMEKESKQYADQARVQQGIVGVSAQNSYGYATGSNIG